MRPQPSGLWLSIMKSCIRLSPVDVHQIVVCRGILRDDLGAEVEGIEKAVHIHHDAADYQRIQPVAQRLR